MAALLADPKVVAAIEARRWVPEQASAVAQCWHEHQVANAVPARPRRAWALSLAAWIAREKREPEKPPPPVERHEGALARWRRQVAEFERETGITVAVAGGGSGDEESGCEPTTTAKAGQR